MQEELKWIAQAGRGGITRSFTSMDGDNQRPKKRATQKRRNSDVLGKINEEYDSEGMPTNLSSSLPRNRFSTKHLEKRPTSLNLSHTWGVRKVEASSLSDSESVPHRVRPHTTSLRAGLSSSNSRGGGGGGGGMKKKSSRYMESMDSLKEVKETPPDPGVGDSNGQDAFPKQFPHSIGKKPMSTYVIGENSDECSTDAEKSSHQVDRMILENPLSVSPSHQCSSLKDESSFLSSSNSISLPNYPTKKKVAFMSCESKSPKMHSVHVEMHYHSNEKNTVKWEEEEEEEEEDIGASNSRVRLIESPTLPRKSDTRKSTPDVNVTFPDSHSITLNEASTVLHKEKLNSSSSNMKPTITQRMTRRPKPPSFSATNKLSLSQPCVGSDKDQLLTAHEDESSLSPYHTKERKTNVDHMMTKSRSLDRSHPLPIHGLTSDVKADRTGALLYRAHRSISEMDPDDHSAAGGNT